MNIVELIKEMGRRLGLDDVDYDPREGGELIVGDYRIAIEAMPGCIILTSTIGLVPNNADRAYFHGLLAANYSLDDTGGSALAINPDYDEILLCRNILQDDLTFDAFEREMMMFFHAVESWTEKLKRGETGPNKAGDRDYSKDHIENYTEQFTRRDGSL